MAPRGILACATALALARIVCASSSPEADLGETRADDSVGLKAVGHLLEDDGMAIDRDDALEIQLLQRATHIRPGLEFMKNCPTSACCAQSVPLVMNSATSAPASDGVWTFLYGGAEWCFTDLWPRGRNASVILEEVSAVAHGYCVTFNRRTADNAVHSHLMQSEPTACAHGTAFRISETDYKDYIHHWMNNFPEYKLKAETIVFTTAAGLRLNGTALVHAEPLSDPNPAHESAPSSGYAWQELCEMANRSYCSEYLSRVRGHLKDLGTELWDC